MMQHFENSAVASLRVMPGMLGQGMISNIRVGIGIGEAETIAHPKNNQSNNHQRDEPMQNHRDFEYLREDTKKLLFFDELNFNTDINIVTDEWRMFSKIPVRAF